MLLKHYLEQGVSQSELARRFGIDRTTIWRWVRTAQLDRDLSAGCPKPCRIQHPGTLPGGKNPRQNCCTFICH